MEVQAVEKISVRNLIQAVLRSGDLVSSYVSNTRAVEGTRAHQAVQSTAPSGYTAEVQVSYQIEDAEYPIEITGRIDGILTTDEGVTIDEIKSTNQNLHQIELTTHPKYWAQAKCYAFIYAEQNDLTQISVQLTYYQLETKQIKRLEQSFSLQELRTYFFDLVQYYLVWAKRIHRWQEERDASIQQFQFPFPSYRKGQRELAVAVYRTVTEGKKLFAQAPTGIGKTMATLFPSIKAMGEGQTSKIFYLTAKTITRTIAEKAFAKMHQAGLRFKSLTLTAKEKICFTEGGNCNPEFCKHAKGHFDRVDQAIEEIFEQDAFTRPVIEEFAKKHQVCPFEFSLDLALWADCVVCDYNYLFDPKVYLKRFFMDTSGDYTFLIDEAHNLVDRAREMYSAEIVKQPILDLKREVKGFLPKLAQSLDGLNDFLIQARKICDAENGKNFTQKMLPEEIIPLLRNFTKEADAWLSRNPQAPLSTPLKEIYFQANNFLRIIEFYDDKYITYGEKWGSDVKLKLFCLDPSKLVENALQRGKVAIFFSATFSPIDYFIQLLGGDETSYTVRFPSPFPPENLCVLVNDRISTRYKMRQLTYDQLTEAISLMVSQRQGNYLIFFPSYQYMEEVYQRFIDANPSIDTICQESGMTEEEREEFLQRFSHKNEVTLVGFAVLGGIFGEGIDLTGDRLTGAVVVGVGLPQICLEREIIRNHFQEEKGTGFEYAYVYPGMNKVLQAAGRVIRTETDRGVVCLIDERYSYSSYRCLLPEEWQNLNRVSTSEEIKEQIETFYQS